MWDIHDSRFDAPEKRRRAIIVPVGNQTDLVSAAAAAWRRILFDLTVYKYSLQAKITLGLTVPTREFIDYLNAFGRFRYLEVSNFAFGGNIVTLDRAWELRRSCTFSQEFQKLSLQNGVIPPKYRITEGFLEGVIDDIANPARIPLLWHNAFFGARQRRRVRVHKWMKANNSPLYLNRQFSTKLKNRSSSLKTRQMRIESTADRVLKSLPRTRSLFLWFS
jgi:hypothetical protein